LARAGIFVAQLIQALYPALVSLQHRHAPRAPLPASGVTSCGVMFNTTSDGVTHPSSLILAHAPNQIPPAVFNLTITTGLCRLSPIPAGSWPFPTLSLQSLRRRLDPYPAVSSWCSCSLLPRRQRPHLRRHRFGTLKLSR